MKLSRMVGVLAALALTSAAHVHAQMVAPPPPVPIGSKAPAFATRTTAGKQVSLRSLRGKVILLDFWATWCGPCRMAVPTLEALHRQYHRKGLQVVGISVDDPRTVGLVPAFVKHFGITYPVAAGETGNFRAAQSYNASGIPTQVLIDKRGVVRWAVGGYLYGEKETLAVLIQKLLREKA